MAIRVTRRRLLHLLTGSSALLAGCFEGGHADVNGENVAETADGSTGGPESAEKTGSPASGATTSSRTASAGPTGVARTGTVGTDTARPTERPPGAVSLVNYAADTLVVTVTVDRVGKGQVLRRTVRLSPDQRAEYERALPAPDGPVEYRLTASLTTGTSQEYRFTDRPGDRVRTVDVVVHSPERIEVGRREE